MLDQLISQNINLIQSESLTKLMIVATTIGDKYTIAIFSLIVLLLLIFRKKDFPRTRLFTLTMAAGVILSQALKRIIQRARPENMLIAKDGFSFPSGHSTLAVCFFGMMIYLFRNEIKNKTLRYSFVTINVLMIISIAFSRIYLNVHWLTDVIAGLTLGLICILASIWACKKIPFLNKYKLF